MVGVCGVGLGSRVVVAGRVSVGVGVKMHAAWTRTKIKSKKIEVIKFFFISPPYGVRTSN